MAGSRMKATNEQLASAYADLDSVWKVAEMFGMCGQSVHERLVKLGITTPQNVFTEAEQDRLTRDYAAYASVGKLADLAADMGRTKHFICRQARALGLTDQRRAKPYLAPVLSARMKKWYADNSHPRGMSGKSHSQEVRERAGLATSARWAAMTKDEQSAMTLKRMKAKVEKYGCIATPNSGRGSWKAAWHEIGGVRKFYRSKWESNYARYLEWLKQRGIIAAWRHEPMTFWFEKIKRGVRSYLPDFEVTELDGSISYHEVKGWMDARSKTTINRMRIYHPKVKLLVIDSKQYHAIKAKVSGLVDGWE